MGFSLPGGDRYATIGVEREVAADVRKEKDSCRA